MRGAVLPAALLCAALGLLLAFAPRRTLPAAGLVLLMVAICATFATFASDRVEILYAGCWISVILIAAAVHLRAVPGWLAVAAAADAGLWSGLLIGTEASRIDLVRALPAVLIAIPGTWAVGRRLGIALKVASSWLIAIALLAALLPTAPTPGYVPDHMD